MTKLKQVFSHTAEKKHVILDNSFHQFAQYTVYMSFPDNIPAKFSDTEDIYHPISLHVF
jgi:hypothetical protein